MLRLCQGLGYDFNTVEFAVRGGIPIAIDFGNPAPDADVNSVGAENFEWVVEHAAKLAIERAQAHQDGQDNLTWGTFVQKSAGHPLSIKADNAPAEVGGAVSETNDLGANGGPAPTKKAAAPKKSGAPQPLPATGDVPKSTPKAKSAAAGDAAAKKAAPAKKPAAKAKEKLLA